MNPIQPDTDLNLEENAEDRPQSWTEWLLGDMYASGWKSLIQPPRCSYALDQLGPDHFTMNRKEFVREDLQLNSLQGETLECSHYCPMSSQASMLPCVVYLHGHGSCRLEAKDVVNTLLPRDISVFCFDFAGSGMSQGRYVSFGLLEEKNLVVVLRHLRKTGRVSSIALWGHSMGASVAVLRAAKDHRLAACVLDSPFADLRTVANDLINQRVSLPQFMVDSVIEAMRSEVHENAGFDLQEVVPLRSAPKATCPAFFGVASDDTLVLPEHSKNLHISWGGPKSCFRTFIGGHNGPRPSWFMDEVTDFLVQHLHTWIGDFEVAPLKVDEVLNVVPRSFRRIPPRFLDEHHPPSDETIDRIQTSACERELSTNSATRKIIAVDKVIYKWRERACRSEIATNCVNRESPCSGH